MKKRLGISIDVEVYEKLEIGAKRYGLSLSGYISQLVMQKDIELSAARLINTLSDKEIAEEVKKQFSQR